MPKKVNLKTVTAKAADLVKKQQKVSYDFLREQLKIGMGTVKTILNRLQAKGVVSRGNDRRWRVLVNTDGTKKSDVVPATRRFKAKKHRSAKSAPPAAPKASVVAAKAPAVNGAHVNGAGTITDEMKIDFVGRLAGALEGEKADILNAVVEDLTLLSKQRKVLDALKG